MKVSICCLLATTAEKNWSWKRLVVCALALDNLQPSGLQYALQLHVSEGSQHVSEGSQHGSRSSAATRPLPEPQPPAPSLRPTRGAAANAAVKITQNAVDMRNHADDTAEKAAANKGKAAGKQRATQGRGHDGPANLPPPPASNADELANDDNAKVLLLHRDDHGLVRNHDGVPYAW